MNTKVGIKNWFDLDGDNTLALDWPLNENSHVWEIGGYMGRWAQQIWNKFNCNVTIFEPQLWAVERMHRYFDGIEKIEIRPYGLWTDNKVMPIGDFETDGATIISIPDGRPVGSGLFRNFYEEVRDFEFPINLCLMNIEGAEYELIPAFMASGVITRFEYFWCQFHLKDDPDREKTRHIFERFEKTHEMIWNCFPTAVAWRKR